MSNEPRLSPGDRVTIRGQPGQSGTIVNKQPRQGATGVTLYPVDIGADGVKWIDGEQLEREAEFRIGTVSRRRFLRDLVVLKLSDQYTDVLYSMGASLAPASSFTNTSR